MTSMLGKFALIALKTGNQKRSRENVHDSVNSRDDTLTSKKVKPIDASADTDPCKEAKTDSSKMGDPQVACESGVEKDIPNLHANTFHADKGRSDFSHPKTPRISRRTLRSESLNDIRPSFPLLDRPKSFWKLYRDEPTMYRALNGDDFRVYPGLLDTDSVFLPGVALRLMYSSILPQDEETYFKDIQHNMDLAERRIVEGAQRASLAFGFARSWKKKLDDCLVRNEKMDQTIKDLQERNQKLENYHTHQEKMEQTIRDLQDYNKKLQSECDHFKEDASKYSAMVDDNKKLGEKTCKLLNDVTLLQNELKVEREMVQKLKGELKSVHTTSIQSYRESFDCYQRKCAVGVSFSKTGFYLARQILEEEHGRMYPELVFAKTASVSDSRPWQSFDPDEEDVTSSFNKGLYDDLENLSGPWTFHGKNGIIEDEKIVVLQNLDEDHEVDEDLDDDDDDASATPAS
ncbi:uncharacterized protein [Euphorbia lathyris]|uniref:uncharacterized protein n=1 Tax=Euphorbia lathyris TaxID=212925 RepID=UPI003313FB4A